jgi:hypothetical protein
LNRSAPNFAANVLNAAESPSAFMKIKPPLSTNWRSLAVSASLNLIAW